MFKSYKYKLLLFNILISTVYLLIIGAASYQIMQQYYTTSLKEKLELSSDHLGNLVNSFIRERKEVMLRAAQSREVQEYKEKARDIALAHYLAKFENVYLLMAYINTNGIEEVTTLNGARDDRTVDFSKDPGYLQSLGVHNLPVVAAEGQQMADHTQSLAIFLSMYSYFGDSYLGTLLGVVSFSPLQPMLDAENLGKTGFALLLDQHGHRLLTTNPKGKDEPQNLDFNKGISQEELQKLVKDNHEFTRTTVFGVDSVLSTSRIEETQWQMVVVLPYSEYAEGLHALQRKLALFSIPLLILAIVFSYVLSKPIVALSAQAERIARNQLGHAADGKFDEVALIGRTIDQITTSLSESEAQRTELEANLQQAKKMEAIGTLTGGIAHDFNNLLGGILGYTELALESAEKGSEVHEDLQQIYLTGKKGAQLTREMLEFARPQQLHLEKIVICDSLAFIIDKAKKKCRRKDIDIQLSCLRTCPITTDVVKLEQIILNLLGNAIDAIPSERAGKITIEIDETSFAHELVGVNPLCTTGAYYQVKISDNGCGIDEKNLERIYEPFFTTKDAQKGTGLGLAMVFSTVKQLKGHIQVKSAVGVGTTFTLYLKKELGEELGEEHAAKTEETMETAIPFDGTGITVLVADDADYIRDIVEKMLSAHGFTVVTAVDGNDAIHKFQEIRPDFVLMDKRMPELDGVEAATAILQQFPDAHIVIMTGDNADEKGETALAPKDYLRKPFKSGDLIKKIQQILSPCGTQCGCRGSVEGALWGDQKKT